jgi:hypothetical protein
MQVDEQLRLLKSIWRGHKEGYVFLPYIPVEHARGPERKRSLKNGPAFKVGAWDDIREHLVNHRSDELYFAPMVFTHPRRRSEYATYCSRLWADLDEVDPGSIPDHLTPSILWETSPGRYAGVWFMAGGRAETTERGGENHKLTIALGADPSGWDTTQLLRVPGSANNKPGYPKGIRGKLVSRVDGAHPWEDIDELPELPDTDIAGGDLIDEHLLDGVDAFAAYARLKRSLPAYVRQMMRLKVVESSMDRSHIAWQIERELADAGATLLEMVAILRPTPWNKFEGRADELKRLTLECGKALALKKATAETEEQSNLDVDTDIKDDLVPFWNDISYYDAKPPEWIYYDLIPEGGCGFISGIPKSLKTYFGLDLAISAALGKSFLEHDIDKPINVLYIQREDPTSEVKRRHHVIASSKDARYTLDVPMRDLRPYPGALYVKTMMAIELHDEAWQIWLDEMIRRHDLKLVIFDTLVRSAPGVNLDKSEEVTSLVLNPLKQTAREYNCAMCFVHHNTKAQGNDRSGQNMAGSGQLHAWTDFLIAIKNKDEDPKSGAVRLTVDFETKYTVTRSNLVYMIDGLPDVWDPIPYVTEEQSKPITKADDGETEINFAGPSRKPPAKTRWSAAHRLIKSHIGDRDPSSIGPIEMREMAVKLELGQRTVKKHIEQLMLGYQ